MTIKFLPNPQALLDERVRWLKQHCIVSDIRARLIAHLHWEGQRLGKKKRTVFALLLADGQQVTITESGDGTTQPLFATARLLVAKGVTGRLQLWDNSRSFYRMQGDIERMATVTVSEGSARHYPPQVFKTRRQRQFRG